MDVLLSVLEAFDRFMNAGPQSLVTFLLVLIVVSPVMTLLHELGHATAAIHLLGDEVEVKVGKVGKLLDARIGVLRLRVNGFAPLVGVQGHAMFNQARASAREVIVIALAGPATSACALLASALVLAVMPAGLMHDLAWMAACFNAIAFLNVLPLEFTTKRGEPPTPTDGLVALRAGRVLWQLR